MLIEGFLALLGIKKFDTTLLLISYTDRKRKWGINDISHKISWVVSGVPCGAVQWRCHGCVFPEWAV